MHYIDLNGTWQGECVGKFNFEGQVPGSTINDLISNGKLPRDLLSGTKADEVLPYENSDWNYKKTFSIAKKYSRAILVFERLDTFVDVYFNGQFIGHRENGNLEHKFDVSTLIIEGENSVELKFRSCITTAKAVDEEAISAFTKERLTIRRMQCTFGWDWVARFVCCSIGNASIVIEEDDEVIVDNTYIYTKGVDKYSANVGIEVEFKNDYTGRVLNFEILSPAGERVYGKERFCDFSKARFNINIAKPQLWYPVGYGEQPLYTFIIKDENKVISREVFGIRTVKVLQEKDEEGSENYKKCLEIKHPYYDKNQEFSGFTLIVNEVKIFCKGGNWVPCEPYLTQNRENKIKETLKVAKEMGVNMLRVWGGGAFECKTFYDECSRLGILVTQDFLMACGKYPEKEEWFINELLKETEYAVKLIRNQPCLVWWSGDNENAVDGTDSDKDYLGRDSFYKGIEPVLMKYDPYREAFASSPYGGNTYASNTVGTTHHSQFLSRMFKYIMCEKNLDDYKERLKINRARFIVEEPIFGATSLSSLKKFMTEEEIFSDDMEAWQYHTKNNPGLANELTNYFTVYAGKVLGEFTDNKDRLFKYQYLEYEWVRVVLEQARREKWFCSGIIFWMLNDCWTAAAGWSLVDYYNKIKIGGYAFKRCVKPIIASVFEQDGKYAVSVVNDGVEDANCDLSVYKVTPNGREKISSFSLFVKANEKTVYGFDLKLNEKEILVVDTLSNLNADRAFYKAGGLKIVPVKDSLKYTIDKQNKTVKLKAEKYVHIVALDGDCNFSDNGFSMLDGEEKTVYIKEIANACNFEINVDTYNLEILE